MRPLTLEAYKLMYIVTGAKKFSYYFSLVLNTIMNVIMLKGIHYLMKDIFSPLQFISIIFKFPFYIALGFLLLFINSRVVPFTLVDIVGQIKTKYAKLIIYFLLSIILFAFLYGVDRLF